ncbi:hypothetical protein F0562_018523 [Nyssa sinensis]|uniref:Uncharacterized protein n=1 Tax=Nyssa sinensis TaxID=561372 RepID=A0A5J4ZDA5_9ASTE|nr:hypothetical protein F0562_018523 [Nyssa sinensis]
MAPPTIRTESEARILLETYRDEGLTFIQVRRHDSRGKFHVVCALCGTDRDNDEEMRDHLTTWIHQTMLEMAQKTLFKNNPWPFDDGYIFYQGEQAQGQYLEPPNDSHVGYRNLKRVGYGEIAASLDEVGEKVSKIWCEFLGNSGVHDHLEPSDFDIVTFRFTAKLGCYGIGVLPTEGETSVRAEGFGRQMVVRIRSITFYRAEENQLLPAQ